MPGLCDLRTFLILLVPEIVESVDENLVGTAGLHVLLHESVVGLLVVRIKSKCAPTCLDGFLVLAEFGIAEA